MTPTNDTTGPDAPLLEVRDLQVSFTTTTGEVHAVAGANLTVMPGQTVAIVGESGSGKSTTAHAVIGLLPGNGEVTGGQILFAGEDLAHAGRRRLEQLRGREIGMVPQDPMSNLNPVWSIGFQVAETLRYNGLAHSRAEVQKHTVQALTDAGLPDAEDRASQYPHEFSGGMRQRALIAIGMAARPRLLIADEPTSALDVTVQRRILDHLAEMTHESGTAVLLITHDLGLAAERADHLVVMYHGRVVESGPSLEILRNPRHPYTRRLVASAPSLASRRIQQAAEVADGPDAVDEALAVAGTAAGRIRAGRDRQEGDRGKGVVLEGRHLTQVFSLRGRRGATGELKAVDDVSFALRRGTTLALVGESGSGKSTVANMALGLLAPTSGDVVFDGKPISGLRRRGELAFRRRVQPVFQDPYGSLDPMYSIYRVIEEPLRVHGVGDTASRRARVAELLDRVALPASTGRRFPNELSGGQRQRIAIARALALEPEVLVLDEAVSALDVLVQAQILDLLAELQQNLGLSYLFITHDLAVVRQIADEVIVMQKGRVVETAGTDEVFDHPRDPYTRELLAAIPGAGLDLPFTAV